MQDKIIMTNLLNSTKGCCDLYLHGTIESATPQVHETFDCVLQDTLKMQNAIYNKMAEIGWYPTVEAPAQNINQTKSKFQNYC